ncbi:hypothetical protein [Flavobacterium sp.]
MKTSTLKNVFKLFVFALIVISEPTFSHPGISGKNNSGDCESKFGCVKKTEKTTKTMAGASKATALRSKNLTKK